METVVTCTKTKEWNGKPIYSIGISDGQGGESFQDIPIGTPLTELVITANPNPNYAAKIKWNKPNSGGGFKGGNRGGNESFALSYSKDVAIAYISQGKTIEPEKITSWAETFYNWMESKKK